MDQSGLIFVGILVNALFATAVAYAALERGRSAPGFFFLGFFCSSLFGVLVLIALPEVKEGAQVVSPSGNFSRSGTSVLAKCPNCAEWVKAEAIVCRFCGRDIGPQLASLAEIDKAAAQVAESERRLRDDAIEAARVMRLEREAEKRKSDAAILKAKLKSFFRKRSTLFAGGAVAILLVASGVAWAVTNVVSESASIRDRAATEAAILSAPDDWGNGVIACESLKTDDVSYSLGSDGKRLEVSGFGKPQIIWISCIGQQFAIDPPSDFTGQEVYKNELGWHVRGSIDGDVDSGEGSPLTLEYGNLTVVTTMPANVSHPYRMVISKD